MLSHPAWVCGLKLQYVLWALHRILSHPAWVCGLKPDIFTYNDTAFESHPAWVCGLKQLQIDIVAGTDFVTPCVGVWIETKMF